MSSASLRLSGVSMAAAIAVALIAAPGLASAFMYLKLADVDGETEGSGHGEQIEIHSVQWGSHKAQGGSTTVDANEKITIHGSRTESKLPGTRPPPSVTLKRGTAGSSPMQYNPKEYSVSKSNNWASAAPASGARGSMRTVVPAGTCRAGARYPAAELGTGERVYRMTGVVVTGCSAARSGGGGVAMETLSLSYEKIVWE